MNGKQWIVWLVAAVVWFTFMYPRIMILQHGSEGAQHQALVTLGIFSVVLAVIAAGLTRFLRTPNERRAARPPQPSRPKPIDEAELGSTRATDLLGPGAAARRATRATAERRRRAAS